MPVPVYLLKLVIAFLAMMVVSNVLWEEVVDEKVYDCTDSGIGFLNLPGGDWPLVVVKHVIPNRPIGDPDNILEGWNVTELRCLAGTFFAVSLIATFLLAKLPWPGEPKTSLVSGGSTPSLNYPRWPVAAIVILVGLAAINIFLPLFVVPKFERIYQETIPAMLLPEITRFIIAARIPLALIALAWPITGILAGWRKRRAATWIINLGYLYFFPLIGITVIALFMPLTDGIIVGMSNGPLKSAVSSH